MFQAMNQRRQKLGMSYAEVARRSGVSLPTVVRILTGRQPMASFANVERITDALGLRLGTTAVSRVDEMQESQAREKARRLVGMVQATSGLESQAVVADDVEAMVQQTVHELMAGSKRRLWSE